MEEEEGWQTCVWNWRHDGMGAAIEEGEMRNFLAAVVAAAAARNVAGQRNGWYSYCYSWDKDIRQEEEERRDSRGLHIPIIIYILEKILICGCTQC